MAYINEIEMNYKPKEDNSKNVRIFGTDFVKNNKKNFIIIYKDKEFELTEFFNEIDKDYNNKDIISFKLKQINVFNNISDMFGECDSLILLPDISKLDTSNVEEMSGIFFKCKSLISSPDISKWNTSKVVYMSGIFSECESLISLPDISKWDTSKVIDMKGFFYECNSLKSFPDISI